VHRLKVCVVDDCVDEASMLCESLKLNDYTVLVAYSGEEALRLCEQEKVQVLLLDVGLPDISGYEVCRRLKENPLTQEIAVIFVTARDAQRDIVEGYKLGAVDYIAKPYNLPFVMVRVEAVMRSILSKAPDAGIQESLPDHVYTDQLTGLRNRRYLLERLQEEAEKSRRHGYPLSCLVADVEDIVGLDAELGAASMDDVLSELAMALRNASRNYDILSRFDGALFAAVLPHTGVEDAVHYARKIQEEVDSMTLCEPCFPTSAKLCFGIVTCQEESATGAEEIFGEAMRALLRAKSNGTGFHARDLCPPTAPTSTAM
jgi:two-component system, cell cycle response regulator